METRSVQSRLDVHEQQISHLQFDVAKIKKSIEEDRLANREFRKVMLGWMKQQGKQPQLLTSGNASGVEDPFSGLLFEIPNGGGVHNPQKLDGVSRSEASPVISTSSVIAKLEELISKSEARSSLRANLAPSPISPSIKHLPPVTPTDRNFTNYSGGFDEASQEGLPWIANLESSPNLKPALDCSSYALYLTKDVEEILYPSSGNISQSRFLYHNGLVGGAQQDVKPNMGNHMNPHRPGPYVGMDKNTVVVRSDDNRSSFSNRPYGLTPSDSSLLFNKKQENWKLGSKPVVGHNVKLKTIVDMDYPDPDQGVEQKMVVGLNFSGLDLCEKGKAPFDRGKDSLSHCPLKGPRLTFSITWHLWVVHGQPRPPENVLEEAFSWMSS